MDKKVHQVDKLVNIFMALSIALHKLLTIRKLYTIHIFTNNICTYRHIIVTEFVYLGFFAKSSVNHNSSGRIVLCIFKYI